MQRLDPLLLTILLAGLVGCATGTVVVRSDPEGADVYLVDYKSGQNALLGRTPMTFDKHDKTSIGSDVLTLRIEKEGFQPKLTTIATAGNQTAYVDAKLPRSTVANGDVREAFEKSRVHWKNTNRLVLLKRYSEALVEVEKILELDPKNADGYAAKGSVMYLLKDFAGASNAWNRALELNPNLESVRNNLLELYVNTESGSGGGS